MEEDERSCAGDAPMPCSSSSRRRSASDAESNVSASDCSMLSSFTMRSDDTNDADYAPTSDRGDSDDDGDIFEDNDDDDGRRTKLADLAVERLVIGIGWNDTDANTWDPVLERLRSHPEEADGMIRCGSSFYPSLLHALLLSSLQRGLGALPDGLVASLIRAFPEAARIRPYPLHIVVEILVQQRIPFLSKEDVTCLLDEYPKAAACYSTVEQSAIVDPVSFGTSPLQRIAALGGDIRQRAPANNYRDCLSVCQHLVNEISCYYPSLFTHKTNHENTPVRDLSVAFNPGRYPARWFSPMWSLFRTFLRRTCEASFSMEGLTPEDIDRLLFFAAHKNGCSCSAIHTLVRMMPIVALGRHPENGSSPLAVACKTSVNNYEYVSNHTIRLLIDSDPCALRKPDEKGRLPLQLALEHDRKLDLIEFMVEKEPRALTTSDVLTSLYPFMTAAVGDKQASYPTIKGEWQLDIVFALLRKNPTLAVGLTSETPWQRIEKRIRRIESERDEWKTRAERYRAENEMLKAKLAAMCRQTP